MKEYINANNTYEVRGTSAEDKPVGKYPPFTVFHEMDTGADYYLDEVSNTWKPVGGGGEYDMVIEAEWQDSASGVFNVYDYTILSGTYNRLRSKLLAGEMPRVLVKTKDYYSEDMLIGAAVANTVHEGFKSDGEPLLVINWVRFDWLVGPSYVYPVDTSSDLSVTPTYSIVINHDNEIVYYA